MRCRCRSRLRYGSRCRLLLNRCSHRNRLLIRLLVLLLRLLIGLLILLRLLGLLRSDLNQRLIYLRLVSGVVFCIKTCVLAYCQNSFIRNSQNYIAENCVLENAVNSAVTAQDTLGNTHEYKINCNSIICNLYH